MSDFYKSQSQLFTIITGLPIARSTLAQWVGACGVQLQTGIDRYIQYYNHDRIKLKLDGLSPVEYRMRFA